MGATFGVLAGLALVLSHGSQVVASAQAAQKRAEDVKAKAQRLYSELEQAQAQHEATTSWLSDTKGPLSSAEAAGHVEEMGDCIDRMRMALRRVEMGADFLERSLVASAAQAHALARIYPGWREAVAKVHGGLGKLRTEIQRFDRHVEANHGLAEEILVRSLAEQGLREWAANLPPEECALFDETDALAVRWDRNLGWVESAR
jgi:hypothetical protein